MTHNTDEIVAKYVALRDKKSVLKAEYDAEVGKVEKAMEAIETYLMALMQELKVDQLKTGHGTAYTVERVKASIPDREAARAFVLETKNLDLIELRASSKGVQTYMQEHGVVPAGFAVITENSVQIRRA